MSTPIEVVGEWLQNLLDPGVVNRVVAPRCHLRVTQHRQPGAQTDRAVGRHLTDGPQAFLDNLGMMFTRWENQAFNVTTMFASDENVAVFGDFRYKSHSLGKIVSSPSPSW